MKIKLSICIPTFNREPLLIALINEFTSQIRENNLKDVEIVVSDNNSRDKTRKSVLEIIKKNKFVNYHRNEKNIGGIKNVIKVTEYAKGEYIWFFSDDDILNKGGLMEVYKELGKGIDLVYCNLNCVGENGVTVKKRNSFGIEKNYVFNNRRNFFEFLIKKFIYEIDWFTTFYSSIVLRKDILENSRKLIDSYTKEEDIFPQTIPIYYSDAVKKIKVLSDQILSFREQNTSWGPKNKIMFLKFWDKALTNHYNNIVRLNSDYLSLRFRIGLGVKNAIRKMRLVYLTAFQNV